MKMSITHNAVGFPLLTAALAVTLAVMNVDVAADDAHHPEKTQAAQPPGQSSGITGGGMTGGGMMMSDGDMQRMQDQMRKMQIQMDEIRRTTDPKKRDRLIDEHMQSMQEGMEMMRGMGGGMMQGMMGGGMHSGNPMQGGNMSKTDDMMGRMDMMEKRMDMMQMMMEQMTQSRRVERRKYGPQK